MKIKHDFRLNLLSLNFRIYTLVQRRKPFFNIFFLHRWRSDHYGTISVRNPFMVTKLNIEEVASSEQSEKSTTFFLTSFRWYNNMVCLSNRGVIRDWIDCGLSVYWIWARLRLDSIDQIILTHIIFQLSRWNTISLLVPEDFQNIQNIIDWFQLVYQWLKRWLLKSLQLMK